MTRIEAFDDAKEVVYKHIAQDHPEYTSSDKRIVLDLLDDIERLLKG